MSKKPKAGPYRVDVAGWVVGPHIGLWPEGNILSGKIIALYLNTAYQAGKRSRSKRRGKK